MAARDFEDRISGPSGSGESIGDFRKLPLADEEPVFPDRGIHFGKSHAELLLKDPAILAKQGLNLGHRFTLENQGSGREEAAHLPQPIEVP